MSTIYVPGPAYIWPGVGTNRAFVFLGFTERGLNISFSGVYEDVNVDYAGNMPADIAMLGQRATISGEFTRYNEDVANACSAFLWGMLPGVGSTNSMGSLMTIEEGSYPLIVYCPYAIKQVTDVRLSSQPNPPQQQRLVNMNALYHFPSVYLAENFEVTLSVKRKAPRMSWNAIGVFGAFTDPTTFKPGEPPFNAYRLYATYPYADISTALSPLGITLQDLINKVN